MSIESLKEEARNHEQREEWGKALSLYLKAVERLVQEDQPDISLYNRIGDIQTRMGNLDGAVGHYEQAIDLYVESGLPNNAIAVCKKVLRNLPSRTPIFLRMGQIRAAQGFLTDARQNFLTYAETMQKAGEMEEAFRALREFADLAPEDVEVRFAVASQLESHGRAEEAVQELLKGRHALASQGEADEVARVEERILALDPEFEFPPAHLPLEPAFGEEESSGQGDGAFGFEATALVEADVGPEADEEPSPQEFLVSGTMDFDSGPDDQELEPDIAPPAPSVELEPTSFRGPEAMEWDREDLETGTLEGLEFHMEPVESGAESLQEFQPEDEEEESSDLDGFPPLPLLGEPDGDREAEEEVAADGREERWEGKIEEDEYEDEGEGVTDLPFIPLDEAMEEVPPEEDAAAELQGAVSGEEVGDAWESATALISQLEELRRASGEDPRDGGLLLQLGRALMQEGEEREAAETLERAHPLLAAAGEWKGALEAVRLLLDEEPDEVRHHRQLVEYSHESGDLSLLLQAFEGLALCLGRIGEGEKARAAFQQVLALDPSNSMAQEGLARLEGEPAEAPAASAWGEERPVPPSAPGSAEDYVDLGSLVLDEAPERTTRWFVPAEEPSGDDQADFGRMLEQFKAKVSEHMAGDDAAAHYDLGTAYKEMGLLDEAIAQFQQSLRADGRNLGALEMLGNCFLEQGQFDVAVRTLDRALALPYQVEDELLGIYYYLGRAHEARGDEARSREFYEKVFSLDINFMDVTDRLRALRN